MQRYLSTTQRSVVWFKKAFDTDDLIIKPPFQRNPVWSDKQKSALIDSILLEYPIPELYMQELIDDAGNQKHVVVDGQQRIRAVLSFLAGEFELDSESPRWPDLAFDDLAAEDRKRLFEYNFIVRLLPEMPEEELRAIFQRINRNTVTLNPQELRHATYWGSFIRLMEELSDLEFWSTSGIFSANDRRRMLDIEYVSELAVAVLNGLQNKKKLLEEFYQQYETNFDDEERVRSIFVSTLGELAQVLPELAVTRWRKKSDFYTLFLKFAQHHAKLPLSAGARQDARAILLDFALTVDRVIADDIPVTEVNEDTQNYIRHVERAASDLGSRKGRQEALDNLLAPVFSVSGSQVILPLSAPA